MTPNRALKAYICLECSLKLVLPQTRIHRSLRPTYQRLPLQPFSTTTRHNTRIHYAPRSRGDLPLPKPNGKRERIRPRSWRSLLKNKTLGQNSSIIVLRDSENKTRHEVVEDEEQNKDELMSGSIPSPEDIVLSMKSQEKLPGQEEVNKHINTLRPFRSIEQSDAPVHVKRDEFESTLEALADGFNSTQLSRYINVQTGKAMLRDQACGSSSLSLNANRYVWRPINTPDNLKGKKALADIIIRQFWNVEIREEVEAQGTMDMKLSPLQFSTFISQGKDSQMSDIGSTHKVKLEALRPQNVVRITADKYKCEKVADAIAKSVAAMHEIQFSLSPFVGDDKKGLEYVLSRFDIEALGARMNSNIEVQRKNKKLVIRGRTQGDAERCQRAILAAIDLPSRTIRELICNEPESSSGFLWPQKDLVRDGQESYGRFCSPQYLGHVDTNPRRVKLRPGRPVVFEERKGTIETLLNQHLSDPDARSGAGHTSNQSNTTINYSAEIGKVLHSSGPGLNSEHRASKLMKQGDFLFAPGGTSLPQFLFYGSGENEIKTENTLRLRLIPSPFRNDSIDSSKTFPGLHLVLELDKSSQTFRLQSFQAEIDERAVSVMLPNLANDVCFIRRKSMDVSRMVDDMQANSFVDTIIKSAGGYGKITPPACVDLRMPEDLMQSVGGFETREIEYYVKSVAFAQQLHFDFLGVDLVNRWSSFPETGLDEEHLFLSLGEQGADEAVDMTRLGGAADQLLRILNRGLGRMGTLLDNIDRGLWLSETKRNEEDRVSATNEMAVA